MEQKKVVCVEIISSILRFKEWYTWGEKGALFREVSSVQGVWNRGVPLYSLFRSQCLWHPHGHCYHSNNTEEKVDQTRETEGELG